VAVVIYAVAALTWEMVPWLVWPDVWWARISNVLGAWFYAPLPLMTLAAVLRRDWFSCKALMLPMLLFGAIYGGIFLPHGSSEHGRPLRVMTANLLETNHDSESLRAALGAEHADIVAVQELSPRMASDLARQASELYPYQVLSPSEDSFGLGILSRFPVTASRPPEYGAGQCSCLRAAIQLDDRLVTVINAHPLAPTIRYVAVGPIELPTDFESKEVDVTLRNLLELVASTRGPLLLVGDFNTSDRQPLYHELSHHLRDAYRSGSQGFGFTFPSGTPHNLMFPLMRLDYIFHTDAWSAHAAWTGYLNGSDHRYVVTDIVLRD
jgi:vancomycin resistance protein VanJ